MQRKLLMNLLHPLPKNKRLQYGISAFTTDFCHEKTAAYIGILMQGSSFFMLYRTVCLTLYEFSEFHLRGLR